LQLLLLLFDFDFEPLRIFFASKSFLEAQALARIFIRAAFL